MPLLSRCLPSFKICPSFLCFGTDRWDLPSLERGGSQLLGRAVLTTLARSAVDTSTKGRRAQLAKMPFFLTTVLFIVCLSCLISRQTLGDIVQGCFQVLGLVMQCDQTDKGRQPTLPLEQVFPHLLL